MKNLNFTFYAISMGITFLFLVSSCKKENQGYEIPQTYQFDNVNYSGQTYRLSMLTELSTYLKSANVYQANALLATRIQNMFTNTNNPFSDTSLNNSGKRLSDKLASSELNTFSQLLDSIAFVSLSTANNNPTQGLSGIMTNSAGTKSYLVNSKGVELAQLIEKGLMGACFYYQSTAVYLGEGKMNVDNETIVPGEGTTMEHHWDEAFGYLGVPRDFPANLTGIQFWGKYLNDRNSLMGLNSSLMNDFIAGRAAISHNDLGERDVKITSIRRNWELIVAATALSYLNKAIAAYNTDAAEKHHSLSEGYAFIYSLKFGGNATITSSSVDAILISLGGTSNLLQIDFYNTSLAQIQNAKDALLSQFSSLQNIKDSL